MKNLLLIGLLISSIYAETIEPKEYYDFGVEGHLYDIQEEDFHVKFLKEIKENIELNKNYEEDVKENIQKLATFKSDLPLCLNDKMIEEIDYAEVPEDIINPLGRLIYKKGEKIESKLKAGKEFAIFYIDGRNSENMHNQINKIKSNYKQSFFLVNNYDVLKLAEQYPDKEFFPSSKGQEDRFNVRCYPSKVEFFDNKRRIYNLSYDKFNN